ncbi:T9SS type A sorting domain-containing protein [Flavobacterium sp. C4GT6]
MNGRLVKQQTVTTGTNKVDIDALEAAQYIFDITTDNGSVSKKVIKYRP